MATCDKAPPRLFELAANRLESRIKEQKPLYTDAEAIAEANRCLYCYDAPCTIACPTEIDIPEFIRRIATGNVAGSAETILSSNMLGLSCAEVCPVEVLCAGSCVYTTWKREPIAIGRLQRYATEHAYQNDLHFFHPGPSTGKKVALIGAGPASLACAAELSILGHQAVILEGRDLPGGLNTTGIASYKMRAEDSLREVAYIQHTLGVEIRTGVKIGQDMPLSDLERDYDAIFIGVGLGADGRLNLPNESLPGVVGAVDLIEQIKNKGDLDLSGIKHAVIIGGGNTSVDAVRALCQLGVPRVSLTYRRSEADMPAYAHEVTYARKEGAQLYFNTQPTEILGRDRVTGIRCHSSLSGESFDLPADLIVLAVGQGKLGELFSDVTGLKLDKGIVVTDPTTGQTGNPQYFSGGDCANGGKEVVNASAEGKRAAHGIDRYLKGR